MPQATPLVVDRRDRSPRGGNLLAERLRISTSISAYYVKNMVTPLQVIAVLNREGISFVLVGAHGVGSWMREPRATQDVDVVVAEKHLKKATRVLVAEFPHLTPRDEEVVVRLLDRESGTALIDLIKPRALYRETFKHTYAVSAGTENYRIPSLAMALAMKFAAMVSPNRPAGKKHRDAGDFTFIVEQNPEIDDAELTRLGEHVYGGGGADLREMVRQVRAGETLVL
jgi:hypothetical protein